MLRCLSVTLPVLAILVSAARAEEKLGEPPSVVSTEPRNLPMQLAFNLPLNWATAGSVAGSVYAGITDHVALRFNVASWHPMSPVIADVFAAAGGDDGDEASRSGRVTDVGVGVVHYSRGLWDGFTVEAGALRRATSTRVEDENATPQILTTDTATYSARVLVGWSWLIDHWGVVSWAVGASAGYESGTETHAGELDHMPPMTVDVGRAKVGAEGYLRFGAAFDL